MYVAIRVGDEVSAAFALSPLARSATGAKQMLHLPRRADQTGIAIRQGELYQTAEATSKCEVWLTA